MNLTAREARNSTYLINPAAQVISFLSRARFCDLFCRVFLSVLFIPAAGLSSAKIKTYLAKDWRLVTACLIPARPHGIYRTALRGIRHKVSKVCGADGDTLARRGQSWWSSILHVVSGDKGRFKSCHTLFFKRPRLTVGHEGANLSKKNGSGKSSSTLICFSSGLNPIGLLSALYRC